jgi:DNA replication and repair protein RecF
MQVERLEVRNLRLYASAVLPCAPGINVLFGPNGAGKTTLLEALCLGAWGKTLESPDSALVRTGAPHYWVRLDARTALGAPYWVEVTYSPEQGKQIRSAYGSSLSPRELIGTLPLVFLSPAMKAITSGAPQERRRFLDMVLSQSSPAYVEVLLEQRRALRQRNALLQHFQSTPDFPTQWHSWTEVFIRCSAELIWRRWQFIQEFEPLVQTYYRRIAPETLQLRYLPDSLRPECMEKGTEAIAACLRQRARQLEAEELRRGVTLFGPQKDELLFLLNGMVARQTASQGQHKSIVLSLKLAELSYIQQQRNEVPVVAFDDVFAELDAERAHHVLQVLQEYAAQTFITVTEPERLPALSALRLHRFRIEAGTLRAVEQV